MVSKLPESEDKTFLMNKLEKLIRLMSVIVYDLTVLKKSYLIITNGI